ncbi:hypothetical protein J6590_033281 [Homalodisca vitripennis]|nr:hypothetical protein J6590_033281 [Homalodisca vitripennis]
MCCGRKKATQRDEIDRGRGWGLGEGDPSMMADTSLIMPDGIYYVKVLYRRGSWYTTAGIPLLVDDKPFTTWSSDIGERCVLEESKNLLASTKDTLVDLQLVLIGIVSMLGDKKLGNNGEGYVCYLMRLEDDKGEPMLADGSAMLI